MLFGCGGNFHMQMQWMIVLDLLLNEIDDHGIVFLILGDNILL